MMAFKSVRYLKWITLSLLGIIQLIQCVSLRLYSDDITLEHYVEVPLNDSESILEEDYYNIHRINFIYAFGQFSTPDKEATVTVIKAVVALKEYNVFLLNWEEEAAALSTVTPASLTPYIKSISLVVNGVPQTYKMGIQLGEALIRMANVGFDLTKTYLGGHSLGAQLVGQAGRTVVGEGQMVERIYGLDPSYHGIYGKNIPSLSTGDARYVFCLHTDPGTFGINKTLCHADVYVNFQAFTQPDEEKQIQPGCPVGTFKKYTPNDTCSHNRAWKLFSEGQKSPNCLVACEADNVWDWERGIRDCGDRITLSIDSKQRSGVFFMNTNPTSPYGQGIAGCCPRSAQNSNETNR